MYAIFTMNPNFAIIPVCVRHGNMHDIAGRLRSFFILLICWNRKYLVYYSAFWNECWQFACADILENANSNNECKYSMQLPWFIMLRYKAV